VNLLVRRAEPSPLQCPAARSLSVVLPPPPVGAESPAPCEADIAPSRAVSAAPPSVGAELAWPGPRATAMLSLTQLYIYSYN